MKIIAEVREFTQKQQKGVEGFIAPAQPARKTVTLGKAAAI